MEWLLFWIFWWLVFWSISGGIIGHYARKNWLRGAALGMLLSPIGLLLIAVIPDRRRKCSACRSAVPDEAMACRYCRADLAPFVVSPIEFGVVEALAAAYLFLLVSPFLLYSLIFAIGLGMETAQNKTSLIVLAVSGALAVTAAAFAGLSKYRDHARSAVSAGKAALIRYGLAIARGFLAFPQTIDSGLRRMAGDGNELIYRFLWCLTVLAAGGAIAAAAVVAHHLFF